MTPVKKHKKKLAKKKIPFIYRDLSWLSFNDRVLQEAEDPSVPLMERMKFLGIFSNNRDEFFRVRVATIKRMVRLGKKGLDLIGQDPVDLLEKIVEFSKESEEKFERVYTNLLLELEKHNVFIINEKTLNDKHAQFVKDYFHDEVMPFLVPIMLDSTRKFPYLKDKSIYLAIRLSRAGKKPRHSLVEVPADILSRFLVLPQIGKKKYIILLDDVIRFCLDEMFYLFDYTKIEAHTIKLTRDAELDIDNDVSKNILEKISRSLKKRKMGQPVRFVYDAEMPDETLDYFSKRIKFIGSDSLIPGGRYHNFKDFMKFPDLGMKHLTYPQRHASSHRDLPPGASMFGVLKKKDIMLHYPYQSFHHIINLLREASIDPRVVSISATLYRAARNSNVMNALINAVKNGKQVTVVVELQARFDEENNIYWANRLQEEGAKVIYGVPGLKVHSKLVLITRKEGKEIVKYAHVGTGNFNEQTAKIYSDKSLLTADPRIAEEVEKIFHFFGDNITPGTYKHLIVSPFNMRKKFLQLINNEIQNAKKKKRAELVIKMNSLTDPELIRKLYEASAAGVQIKLIIRGICSLVTETEGFSNNIQAVSIVGEYLEHARVFIFYNGGDEKYFISSADWMIRNLNYRSEVAVPIYNKDIQKEMKDVINIQLKDNTKARILNKRQDNRLRAKTGSGKFVSQEQIFKYFSEQAVKPIKPIKS
ncbi:MAG TPA: polyphosphate kinase 1 [Bacteroidia bacterium]|nr:polyphosphate kinase 1 [Bacteroidia bacterium]